MTSRFRLVVLFASLILSGCGGVFDVGPVGYVENERLTSEIPDKYVIVPEKAQEDKPTAGVNGQVYEGSKGLEEATRELKAKYPSGHKVVNLSPLVRNAVRKALADLFGPSPQVIKVPKGSGLPGGGRRLASHCLETRGGKELRARQLVKVFNLDTAAPIMDPKTGKQKEEVAAGGYELYRQHCLHCHGVSGDGAGPTAEFLYPRPRDYRRGIFKFTSTPFGSKPTRDDLLKTIRLGLPGTSMPSFDSMMASQELEQVIDYVIFLSMRGEVESGLIDVVAVADVTEPDPLPADVLDGVVQTVFTKWGSANNDVVNPPSRRTPSTPDSIAKGREMFLGRTEQRLECGGCHGPQARGDGPSFIDQRIFNLVVFERRELDEAIGKVYRWDEEKAHAAQEHGSAHGEAPIEPFDRFLQKNKDLWRQKVDDWGQPLRPANLNLGMYKGGRRPLDLYWRISKGINGAQMPGHSSALNPEQIWDLVNFVLALPYDPELLRDAQLGPLPGTAVAQRSAQEAAVPGP